MSKDEALSTARALKLALEALETCNWVDDGGYGHAEYDHVSTSKAITAIKEALMSVPDGAQPEHGWTPERIAGMARLKDAQDKRLAQPSVSVEQEPDYYGLTADHLWMSISKDHYDRLKPEYRMTCYTTPPQRTWVGLTDKDWNRSKHNYDFQKGVDWAESILKEKNT